MGMSSLLVQVVKLPTGWAVLSPGGGAVVVALGIGVTGSAPTPPNGSPTTPASARLPSTHRTKWTTLRGKISRFLQTWSEKLTDPVRRRFNTTESNMPGYR